MSRAATWVGSVSSTLGSLPSKASGVDVGVLSMYCASIALALFAFGYAIRGGTLLFGVVNLTLVFLLVAVLCVGVHFWAAREIRFQLIWADLVLIGFALLMLLNSSSAAGLEKGLRFAGLVLAPYFLARLILVEFRWVKSFLITLLATVTVIGVMAFAYSVLPDPLARFLPYEITEWGERLAFLNVNPVPLGMLFVVGAMLHLGLMSGWRRIWIIPSLAVTGALVYTMLIVGTRSALVAIFGALLTAILISLITRRFSNFPVLLIAFGTTAFLFYTIFASGLVFPTGEVNEAGIRHEDEPKRVGELVSVYLVSDKGHRADDDPVQPWLWQRADPLTDVPNLPDDATWSDIEGARGFNYTPTDDDQDKFLRAYVYYEKDGETLLAQTVAIGPIGAPAADTDERTESNASSAPQPAAAGISHEAEPKREGEPISAYLVRDHLYRTDEDPVNPWHWQWANPRSEAPDPPQDATWTWAYASEIGVPLSFSHTPTNDDQGKFLRAYAYYEEEGETHPAQTAAIGQMETASADTDERAESNALPTPQLGVAGIRPETERKRVGDPIFAYLVDDLLHWVDDDPVQPWRWQRADFHADIPYLPDDATWTDIDGALLYTYTPTDDDRRKFLRAYVYYEKDGETYWAQTISIGPIAAADADTGKRIESNTLYVPQPGVAGIKPVDEPKRVGETVSAYLVHDRRHRGDDDPAQPWRWQRADPRADAPNLPDETTWTAGEVHRPETFTYTPTDDDQGKFLRAFMYYEKDGATYRAQTISIGPIAAAVVDGVAGIKNEAEPKRVGEPVSAYLVHDRLHRADDAPIQRWLWQRADPRGDAPNLPDDTTWSWAYTNQIGVPPSFRYTPTDDDQGKFLRAYVYYEKDGATYRAQTISIGPIAAAADALSVPQPGIAGIKSGSEPKQVGELISTYLVHDKPHRADDAPIQRWLWQRADPRGDAPNLPDDTTWSWAYTNQIGVPPSFRYTPTDDDQGKFLRAYVYYEKGGETYRAQTVAVGPITAAAADTDVRTKSSALPVPQPPAADTDVRTKSSASPVPQPGVADTDVRTKSNPLPVPQPGVAGIRAEAESKRVGEPVSAYLVHDQVHRDDDDQIQRWLWQRADPRADARNLPDNTTWSWAYTNQIGVSPSFRYTPTDDDEGKFLRAYVYYEKGGETYRAQTIAVGPIATGQQTTPAPAYTTTGFSLPRTGIRLPNQGRFETLTLLVNPVDEENEAELRRRQHVIGARLDLLQEALTKFRANPLLGAGTAGMDNYAHNIFAETAAELGLTGLAILLAFFAFVLRNLWKFFVKLDEQNPYFHIIAAVFLVLTALFIQKQFSASLAHHKDLIIFAAIILNLPLLLGMPGREVSGGLREKFPPRLRFLAPARDSAPVRDVKTRP